MPYVYIATDVEADGPIPGDYSMLSIGSAAFSTAQGILDTFSVNLLPLPEAKQHAKTMEWWRRNTEQWNAINKNQKGPADGIRQYGNWLKTYSEASLVFVSDYVGFDLQFVRWYMVHFLDWDPFWTSQLDLMSYASALTKRPQPDHSHRRVPERWLTETSHDHTALNDAVTHARMALAMMRENGHVES